MLNPRMNSSRHSDRGSTFASLYVLPSPFTLAYTRAITCT